MQGNKDVIYDRLTEYFFREHGISLDLFRTRDNQFICSSKKHFEVHTLGENAVFVGCGEMMEWSKAHFLEKDGKDILSGVNLTAIDERLLEDDKRLSGEFVRYFHMERQER